MSVLTLLLTGDLFGPVPPLAGVSVDGHMPLQVPVLAVRGSTPQRVDITLIPGGHAVRVTFLNDSYEGAGKDRNLRFEGALLDGYPVPGALPRDLKSTGESVVFAVAAAAAEVFDFTAAFEAVHKQLDHLQASIDAKNPPPPPPPATKPNWTTGVVYAAGSTIDVPAGEFIGVLDVAPEFTPLVIAGTGMRKTVMDGQGGGPEGSPTRLAWGKAIIHARGTTGARGIGFKNGGGRDRVSSGEAGVYPELFTKPGTFRAELCAFDGCENGAFSARDGTGGNITMELDRCVFGRLAPNGAAGDELGHDFYLNCDLVDVQRCIFVGNAIGNTMKGRMNRLVLRDNYIGRSETAGRWIDCPGGTDIISSGNQFVDRTVDSAAGGANCVGLFDEADTQVNAGRFGSWVSTDDTFYFRRWESTIWINHGQTRVEFLRTRVFWIGAPGDTPPRVTIRGPGSIGGFNPFTFTASNRVDAAPSVPADPT